MEKFTMYRGNIKDIENEKYSKIKEYLKFCLTAKEKEAGRYDLTKTVFAFVQKYETKSEKEIPVEGHRKYIDLQFLASGSEKMGCCSYTDSTAINEYDEKGDGQLFKCDKVEYMEYSTGDFALFFPKDLHKPRCLNEKTENIIKVVVKIPIDELSCD